MLRVHDLQLPIDEATEMLAAIRTGEIDALVVSAPDEPPRVFLLKGADEARVNEALRAEIAERARLAEELSRKAEELAAADRRKDEFLSMLAHELRNPLSPILTSVEMLRRLGREDPKVERYRAIIERQTRNLTRLVEDLLDVSRITRGTITLRPRPADLATLVRSAVEAARPQIEASEHALSISLPERPIEISVDPTRFEQVLVNLLNNAAKYTERGGAIALTAEVLGDTLTLRVRDNGVGIPSDLLPHVFDLFVQGKRSLARSQGGLGIGLTLVRSLVDLHGGTVEVRSDGPGKGTEVVVRMPLQAVEQVSSLTPVPDPRETGKIAALKVGARAPVGDVSTADGASIRVLVVEDNVDAAESLVELLEHWGFDVQWVKDGEAAVRAADEHRPHVSLVDIGLPGIDGFQVARGIRALTLSRPPLLVGLTGYGQRADREQGAQAGFDHYLVKPLDADMLQGILQRASLFPAPAAR